MPALTAPERPDIAVRVGDPRVPLDPRHARNLGARLTPREIERAQPDIDLHAIMSDPARRTSPAVFDAAVGSLGVLGYGPAWLARALGLPVATLAPRQRRILPYRMRMALTAAIRIGNRWATPEGTGQTSEQIRTVHEQAIRSGFLVPAAYGNCYEREGGMALQDEVAPVMTGRWKRTPDETMAAKVRAVAYFCQYGGTTESVGARFGLSARTVCRARYEELGIKVATVALNVTRVAPGQDDIVSAVIDAANALAIEEPRKVYEQLRAFAVQRQESLAARQAARAAAETAAAARRRAARARATLSVENPKIVAARRAALLEDHAQRQAHRQDNAA